MTDDPMSLTEGLSFVGLAGIIDPLRTEAKSAVGTALTAGIDVRMITGDHAITAQAIGEELGLGPGAISGAELLALSDEQLKQQLPELHVFGRVTPEDKLRLARTMQEQGLIVAMTGDAVNDAAALKQADIGVAMGSGSEVTKQAARMVLTDDNFGTLVHAVEIGRRVYDKVVSYVRYQMTQLLSLVLLFLAATVFDINDGVAMTPSMVLFLLFFATAVGVVIIAVDPGDPDVMHRPPRDPAVPITNRSAVIRWIVYAARALPGRVGTAGGGAGRAEYDARHRLDDDDVRGDGSGDRVQRGGQPARPGQRIDTTDREGAGIGLIPVVLVFLATQLPTIQERDAHRLAQSAPVARPASAWPRFSRSSSSWTRWSGGAGCGRRRHSARSTPSRRLGPGAPKR